MGDSGPAHWQTRWLAGRPGFRRVEQRDWDAPACADWVAALDAAVAEAGPRSLLVSAGAAGHLDSASGRGEWPAGLDLLVELASRRARRACGA